jgi:hypothetical protein
MHLSLRWRLAAGIVLAFAVTLTVIFFSPVRLQRPSRQPGRQPVRRAQAMQAELTLAGTSTTHAFATSFSVSEREAESRSSQSFATLMGAPDHCGVQGRACR